MRQRRRVASGSTSSNSNTCSSPPSPPIEPPDTANKSDPKPFIIPIVMWRQVGIVVVAACALWSLVYMLVGSTSSGKSWYGNLASNSALQDSKGGVPILTLAVPVLIAGSVSALLNVKSGGRMMRTLLWRPWMYRCTRTRGDVNFNGLALVLIAIPLLIYLLASIRRKVSGNMSYDDKIMKVSNCFALMALVAFSFFLIPVARHSAILQLLNWTPAAAVRLHIWSGRIFIVGVLVHGIMHMYRWVSISGESLFGMMFPPGPCWTLQDDIDYEPTCVDPDSDCSCYDHFRNLTGVLAAVGLIVIGISTLNYIRRHYYRIFYLIHVWSAPFVIVMSILHWQRSILYMAPSLLYYVASSFPIMAEAFLKMRKDGGVKILSVEKIVPGQNSRPCIALTVAASDLASVNYSPGQYVKLSCPDISRISHPFTVNRVVAKTGELRIVFRITGKFTSELANRLMMNKQQPPLLHLDGFHGTTQRVHQALSHSQVVMIAGGIGITPFLSILLEMNSVLVARQDQTTAITLHWMCRDDDLVQYVRANYLERLFRKQSSKGNFRMFLIVHKTGVQSSGATTSGQDTNESAAHTATAGEAFSAPHFSSGTTGGIVGNIPPFVTFSSIAWIGLWAVWYVYENVIKKHEIIGRGWACLAILVIGVALSVLAVLALQLITKIQSPRHSPCLVGNGEEEEEDVAIEMGTVEADVIAKEPLVGGGGETTEDSAAVSVSYEERDGRPSIHELVSSLDVDQNPGLFMCGPKSLMQAVRARAEQKCMSRVRNSISGAPQIAIYEETFET